MDVTDERALLARTAELAARYLGTLGTRPIRPEADYGEMLATVDGPVPVDGTDPLALIDELAALAEPGLAAMGSGRYFGFVIGGALPASLAADWLASTWDQNAGLARPTPAASALEAVTGRWVLELLGLPAHSSFAFVTGCQMAHVTSLAAARHAVYERVGYDLREEGLAGAPLFASWSAPSGTSRSRVHSASSGSVVRRNASSRSTTGGGSASTSSRRNSPANRLRPSSAARPAR